MAIGTAHMLGYKLSRNFNMPYLAANIADFWRRWHISLSSWLRDYLFIPLGGSRGTRWQTTRNLLITMTLLCASRTCAEDVQVPCSVELATIGGMQMEIWIFL